MGFYIDLKAITLDTYKEKLKVGYLAPSRMLLRANIDRIFNNIKDHGIHHVEDLHQALKTKKKVEDFSKLTGIDLNYLTILIREIKSLLPKPSLIKDFPDIENNIVSKLEKEGIKNALHLFEKVITKAQRAELASRTGISDESVLKLTKLIDLTRIRWVNHTFAVMLFEAGYPTIEKVRTADHKALYESIKQINIERQFFKGTVGMNDIKLTIEVAKDISLDIDYD